MKSLTWLVAVLILGVGVNGFCGTAKPLVNATPPTEVVVAGGTVLTASIGGSAYQWKKDGVPLMGGTAATLSVAKQKGLTATYYNDTALSVPVCMKTDSSVGFIWYSKSPIPGAVNGDNFSIRWEGKLTPTVTGPVALYVMMDDGARLIVDGKTVLESWKEGPRRELFTRIDMMAGVERKIVLEYMTGVNNASCQLFWQYGSFCKTIIPTNALTANASGNYECMVTTPAGVATTKQIKVVVK